MKILVADKNCSIKVNSYTLSFQELDEVAVSVKKNITTYHVYLKTSDQNKFMPDSVIKNAITYDEVPISKNCVIYIDGKAIEAVLVSCRYFSAKNRYLCVIRHPLVYEQDFVESTISEEYEPIQGLSSITNLKTSKSNSESTEPILGQLPIDIDVEKANNLDI